MLTACQLKRLIYISNKIFHAHIVPPLYINRSPYMFDTGVEQYVFELICHDLNKTLWTIEQDGIRDKLLTSAKHYCHTVNFASS